MKKRILCIMLTLCMVLLLVPISAEAMSIYVDLSILGESTLTLEVESGDSIEAVKGKIETATGYPVTNQILKYEGRVLENGRTLADYNIQKNSIIELSFSPRVSAYATKEQLVDDTFAPNADGTANHIGKLLFGKNGTIPQEWFILGKDSGVTGGTDNTVIFAASPIATGQAFEDDHQNIKTDTSLWSDCTYNGTTPAEVYPNHYGASDLRAALKGMAANTGYFTTAEQNLMNATTVTTKDTKSGTSYTTTDKLYALAADGSGVSYQTLKAGSNDDKVLLRTTYWSTGEIFWSRSPYDIPEISSPVALLAYPGDAIFHYAVSAEGEVRPASNLNLSSVLFASGAQAASSGIIAPGTAMTLRLDGSSKNIGTVRYNTATGDIKATDVSTTGDVALIVQGNDGTNDWYYSKRITGPATLNASTIKSVLTLTGNIDLSACKIWLETKDATDGMIYAVNAKKECTTEAELREAIAFGETITLGADITLSEPLLVNNESTQRDFPLTLNMNDHTLHGSIKLTACKFTVNGQLDADVEAKAYVDSLNLWPGSLYGGTYAGDVVLDKSTIYSGTFKKTVSGSGAIEGGTFYDEVACASVLGGTFLDSCTVTGRISAGIFYGEHDQDKVDSDSCAIIYRNEEKVYAAEYRHLRPGSGLNNPTVVFGGVTPPSKKGCTFLGWYEKDNNGNFTGGSFAFPYTLYDVHPDEKITIYARWEEKNNYTVTFDTTGGNAIDSKTGLKWIDKVFDNVSTPTKIGYTFAGWKCGDKEITTNATYGELAVDDAVMSIEITAQWEANNYTVKFNTDDGNVISDKTSVKWADKVLDNITAPTKNGWEFIGWKCGDVPVTAQTTYSELVSSDAVASIELKAQWKDVGAPVISGVKNGKTYCSARTISVSDNDVIVSVTVNNNPVTLDANNRFTLSPSEGTQTIVVTDKAGNVSAKMIVTVNDGHTEGNKDHKCDFCGVTLSEHTGGEATCKGKAICDYCGKEYGELDNSKHNLENIPAKDATLTETGNKEYWHCKDCGKYFADENGTNEIKLDDMVIAKLSPEIIEETGEGITAGEKKKPAFHSNVALWLTILSVIVGLLTVTVIIALIPNRKGEKDINKVRKRILIALLVILAVVLVTLLALLGLYFTGIQTIGSM